MEVDRIKDNRLTRKIKKSFTIKKGTVRVQLNFPCEFCNTMFILFKKINKYDKKTICKGENLNNQFNNLDYKNLQ